MSNDTSQTTAQPPDKPWRFGFMRVEVATRPWVAWFHRALFLPMAYGLYMGVVKGDGAAFLKIGLAVFVLAALAVAIGVDRRPQAPSDEPGPPQGR